MQVSSRISWSLADLLKDWAQVQIRYANTTISGLSLDSHTTKERDLFFAIQGLHQHGLEFSRQAIANGAAAIVWEPSDVVKQDELADSIPSIPIPALQQQLGFIAQRFYHNPSAEINIIAITGTDGKTSVSQFIAQAFSRLKKTCAVIGTLGYGIYPDLEAATHTTPDAIRVQALLHAFNENQVSHVVIEASSHGLKQGRLNGVEIDTAVFTNLGRDHMDYHPSLKDYGNSKRILFQMPKLKNAVINIDDEFGNQLANELNKQMNVIAYSCDSCSPNFESYINAGKISFTQEGTKIEVNSSWGNATIETKLFGKFNVSNVLAAMGAVLVSGYTFKDVVKTISAVHTVPGRMERVTGIANAPTVIVDYAHTPQALRNVLQVLSQQSTGKLWCVFGCGGDRDPGKRKLMAEVVEQIADYAVVTDDNPRSEAPHAITQEIIAGFSALANYCLIHDRQQAIAYAINHAVSADVVLIAGKGHEVVQIINNQHIPFDDKKIATTCLQNYQR